MVDLYGGLVTESQFRGLNIFCIQEAKLAIRSKRKELAHLHEIIPRSHNRRASNSIQTQQSAPAHFTILSLTDAQPDQVIHQASSKNPIARSTQTGEPDTRENHRQLTGTLIFVKRHGRVMQHVEDSNARKCLGHDVCEHTARRPRVHRLQLREAIPQLRRRVDQHEDVGDLQVARVPEEHPRADAHVSQRVVRREFHDGRELAFSVWALLVLSPELIQPCELEELLGEEESSDEVRLRAEEGKVGVVDVFHRRRREDSVLLRREIVDERCRCEPARCAERDAHLVRLFV